MIKVFQIKKTVLESYNHDIFQVMENTPQEAVLKVLRLANKPERNIRIQCEVDSVVDSENRRADELFRAELSPTKDCELILAR